MAENDPGAEDETSDQTGDEHGDVRRRFEELWNARTSGDAGAVSLNTAWEPIANLLEGHASAEKGVEKPVLPKEGSDEAPRSHPGGSE